MMTKKDFIALADAIRAHNCVAEAEHVFTHKQIDRLAAFCHSCNPRFDRVRWLGYIRGECGPNGGAIRKPKGNTR
jgi:hypothetical protein